MLVHSDWLHSKKVSANAVYESHMACTEECVRVLQLNLEAKERSMDRPRNTIAKATAVLETMTEERDWIKDRISVLKGQL